jgi:peptide/nickel transport system substrate-binding protein
MNKKILCMIASILIIMTLLLVACNTNTSTTNTTATPTATSTTSIATPLTSTTANWWDKFGQPKYGGTITIPYYSPAGIQFEVDSMIGSDYQFWWESTFSSVNWTLDRNTWNYTTDFTPEPYMVGCLVESWERPDLETVIFHIRKGVHWQDKAPVNGRELTAHDVVEHYDRVLGTGSGYTEPAAALIGPFTPNWGKFTTQDDYTVKFNFTKPTGSIGLATLMNAIAVNAIEAPEWVKQGDLQNWRNAVGTGPWILTDYVDGTSETFSRNPNYWGHDERYPENQLPYADTFKVLIINDSSTRLAAFRSGRLDLLTSLSKEELNNVQKTNSDVQYINVPGTADSLVPRIDKAPFGDIRVRKALQLSLNLEDIAKKLNSDPIPCGIVSPAMNGCNYAYKDWPRTLKDEYSYNPTKAKELLAETAADGVFVPNEDGGFNTTLVLSSMYSTEMYEVMKSYFADIGVNMDIQVMDSVAARTYIGTGKHDQFAAGYLAMSQSFTSLLNRFYSKNPEVFLKDSTFDSYYEDMNNANSYDEMAKIMVKADERVIEQHWCITTVPANTFGVWQPYLKGYSGEQIVRWYTGGQVFARLWVGDE